MNEISIIKYSVVILVFVTFIYFLANYREGGYESLSLIKKWQIAFSSFIANFMDTFGIGSFASLFAFRSLFRVMPDNKKFNGTMVIQALLPTLLQSILFLELVRVDSITLLVSCIMISIGGALSGTLVKYVKKETIQLVMLITFVLTAVLIILNKLQLLSIGGDLIAVRGSKLLILGVVMFLAGCLPAFGVGYYSIVLVIIFLLGLSPVVAYPIMTTASAIQMPMTAFPMIKNRQYYSLSTLLMAFPACLAVLIAAPIISKVDTSYLKFVLLIVLTYNVWVLVKPKKS